MVIENLNRAINTYDQKAMQVGSIWLDELVKQINTINPGKNCFSACIHKVGG